MTTMTSMRSPFWKPARRHFASGGVLKWHYRSRCESLIAFSNREFYDGSLITFPMARPGAFSIELVRVDGTYRARSNPNEAAVVAEEAIAFMRQFAEAPEEDLPTLGIVAVDVEQRDFIQEELRRLWADDELVGEFYRGKAASLVAGVCGRTAATVLRAAIR